MVDFYPRSPCGERRKRGSQDRHGYSFLSTLSLRRATLLMWYQCNTVVFLSTLSLRRATRRVLKCDNRAIISIHALLAESDAFRSPRIALMVGFLSTLSLRRATNTGVHHIRYHHDFYPRSPCGERPTLPLTLWQCRTFLSTLSLRRATPSQCRTLASGIFLSTLSLRRATQRQIEFERYSDISIHALLAESDSKSAQNSGVLLRI